MTAKNTNVNPGEDYDFDNDSLNQNNYNCLDPYSEEEIDGMWEDYNDLMDNSEK